MPRAAREVSVASSKKANILIRKGRVIDPANGRDEVADLLIENGRLVRIGASLDAPGADIVDAEGHWVLPGLVDACVHLSLPGSGRSGDIASETRAAAATLYRVLTGMAADLGQGAALADLRPAAETALQEAGFDRVEYLDLRAARDLAPLDRAGPPARLLAAAWLGGVRLII